MPTNPISELVSLARETREKLNCELQNGVGNQIDALCDTIERLERENAELRGLITRMDNTVADCCGCLGHVDEDFREEINRSSLTPSIEGE